MKNKLWVLVFTGICCAISSQVVCAVEKADAASTQDKITRQKNESEARKDDAVGQGVHREDVKEDHHEQLRERHLEEHEDHDK